MGIAAQNFTQVSIRLWGGQAHVRAHPPLFLEAGKITPVIDRTYPLSETSEAIRYLMEGEPQGRVVITA